MIHGPRTITYYVTDLAQAKSWYTAVFETEPYFDEDFYVGFDIEGAELGLLPAKGHAQPGPGGVIAYWGVDDIEEQLQSLLKLGAKPHDAIEDVGGGTKVPSVLDPFGNVIGIIYIPEM
ncbi:MAG: VOC family protein [Candidatus Marinimicrobia bacterium]|nr:VOC family protein [Candidatus Neomarinimicrobiota bacterium]